MLYLFAEANAEAIQEQITRYGSEFNYLFLSKLLAVLTSI